MNQFIKSIAENAAFVLEFIAIVAVIVLFAVAAEKLIAKKNNVSERLLTTRKTAMIGMFSAISGVLMTFEFPVPFAPPFYKIDLSELPVLICGFAFGPVAGVITEFLKVVIKLFLKSTSTAFVGDFANFCIGSSLILPAAIIYRINKKKSTAVIACIVGSVVMTVFGTLFNAVYLLPTFAVMFDMPLDAIIGMGTKINANVTNVFTLAAFCVAPLNLLKSAGVSVLTFVLYKPLSPILKAGIEGSRERGKRV